MLHNEYSLILVPKVQFAALFIYRPIPVYIPLFTFHLSVYVYIAGSCLLSSTPDKSSR